MDAGASDLVSYDEFIFGVRVFYDKLIFLPYRRVIKEVSRTSLAAHVPFQYWNYFDKALLKILRPSRAFNSGQPTRRDI